METLNTSWKIARVLSLIPPLIGIIVLIGWIFDIEIFKTFLPNQINMKANTAIGMIVCGLSIYFLASKTRNIAYQYSIIIASSIILIMAISTIFQYIFRINIGIDELIIIDTSSMVNLGRMSPTTAFCFLNIAVSILLTLHATTLGLRKILIAAFTTTAIIISGIIFLSYLPNVLFEYHILTSASMGVHTALCFILLSSSLLILLVRKHHFQWSFNSQITYGFIIALVIMVYSADAYHNYTNKHIQTDKIIINTQQALRELNNISIELVAVQNTPDNFMVSNKNKYLDQIKIHENNILVAIDEMSKMPTDSKEFQSKITTLTYLIKNIFNEKYNIVNNNKINSSFSNLSKNINDTSTLLKQLQNEINTAFYSSFYQENVKFYQLFLLSPLSIFSAITLLCIGLFLLNSSRLAKIKNDAVRNKLAAIVDSSSDGIISKDLNGIITSWNSGAEQIFGFTEKEMIGKSISILFPTDKLDEEPKILKRIANGEKINHFETVRTRKDGKPINVSVTISPLKNSNNEIIGASKIVRDITDNKRLEQQLRQSQKMGAIGQLAGGIAHDFNNLLGIIIGNLELSERSLTQNEEALNRVHIALKAANHGADLTKRLLTFSRQQPLASKPSDINKSINTLIEMASEILTNKIQIITELDPSLPLALVDVAQLETALLNLVINARDAMPNGGKLILSSQVRELNDTYLSVQTNEVKSGPYISISISDTGHGIPAEIIERVYEPFFTTKGRGKGTGMGLSMVYGFAKQSGGTVKIYSEPNHGTTVTIYLPLAHTSVLPKDKIPSLPKTIMGNKVLIVDDELDLLDVASVYLQEMGFEVYQATNAANAMEMFRRVPNISILLTDIVMPGEMNGVQLANKILEMHPDITVIYTSGFPLVTLKEKEATKIAGHFLNKPYQRDEFIKLFKTITEKNSIPI